jgi:aromatic ring-cleaving dioxygenase
MKYFHVHVYFETKDKELAQTCFEKALLIDLFDTVKFQEQPIGPHPRGMVEMHFRDPCYDRVIDWVKTNQDGLTTMIHQDTGDDYKDHTEHIQWLGKPLTLNFSFFELIKTRPDLRVNQI